MIFHTLDVVYLNPEIKRYYGENLIIFYVSGLPSFKIFGYSRSDIPEMAVSFANGETHEMELEPYSNSPCNFIGKLKNVRSSLAVTGCMKKAGDKMHITLLADGNTKSAIYELDFDGHVTAQKNPFRKQTGMNVSF